MAQKDPDVCERHPFEVEASGEKGRQSSTAFSGGQNKLRDDTDSVMKNGGEKLAGFCKSYRKTICLSALFVISAGAIGGLAGYTLKPGDEALEMIRDRIDALEKQSGTQVFKVDVLEKALPEIGEELQRFKKQSDALKNKTDVHGSKVDVLEAALFDIEGELLSVNKRTDALENQTDAHGSKIDILETTLSVIDCSSSVNSTLNILPNNLQETSSTTIISATTTFASPTMTTNASAFQVLKTNETVYENYSFLALQVRVPYDGLSASENWCRDYENLCKHFGRRPTGCGVSFTDDKYKTCAAVYNSDMNIEGVLGCPPSGITRLVTDAFPGSSPTPLNFLNVFGFHDCNAERCKNTIRNSYNALYKMTYFWLNNMTTMYTACR